jgi:LysM repeat protein
MRGRLVIFAGPLILALLVVAAGWLATSAVATDATTGSATTKVVVQPGDTLWQVAEEVAPSVDPRETVAVIIEMNDLSSASVQAGQSLLVPVV